MQKGLVAPDAGSSALSGIGCLRTKTTRRDRVTARGGIQVQIQEPGVKQRKTRMDLPGPPAKDPNCSRGENWKIRELREYANGGRGPVQKGREGKKKMLRMICSVPHRARGSGVPSTGAYKLVWAGTCPSSSWAGRLFIFPNSRDCWAGSTSSNPHHHRPTRFQRHFQLGFFCTQSDRWRFKRRFESFRSSRPAWEEILSSCRDTSNMMPSYCTFGPHHGTDIFH